MMTEWLITISDATSPVELTVDLSALDLHCLLPIAIICALCVGATALWAMTVGTYTRSHQEHP